MLSKPELMTILKDLGTSIDLDKVAGDTPLTAIGIDSLDFFNVLIELEKRTGTTVPDEDVDGINTINDILKYFS